MTQFRETADVAIPELAGHQRRLLLAGGVLALLSLVGLITKVIRDVLATFATAMPVDSNVT